jgi:hypothetical protein
MQTRAPVLIQSALKVDDKLIALVRPPKKKKVSVMFPEAMFFQLEGFVMTHGNSDGL